MKIERLPEGGFEEPALYASVVEGQVIWSFKQNNDYRVWSLKDQIVVSATEWFSSDGQFRLISSHLTPEQAVLVCHNTAHAAADLVNKETSNGT